MTVTANKDERKLSIFVKRDLDDYGLDPYEFRLYSRIARRAGNQDAWESIPNMARACKISLSRARRAIKLLELAGLIESVERVGYSTIRRLTPQSEWINPDHLDEIRQFLKTKKSNEIATPTRNDRGVITNLISLPLSKIVDEGIPIEGISNKVTPISPTTSKEVMEGVKAIKKENESKTIGIGLLELSEQLAQLLQNALEPVFSSFIAKTRSVLSVERAPLSDEGALSSQKIDTPTPMSTKSPSKTPTKNYLVWEMPENAQLLKELSVLTTESVDSLRRNSHLTAALMQHPDYVEDAFLYFKQAVATWKNKPGLGLFISAVKKGAKPSLTKPGSGWKEWADEAWRRRLMDYSEAVGADIMVHFTSGAKRLWSELRSLDWAEIELISLQPI